MPTKLSGEAVKDLVLASLFKPEELVDGGSIPPGVPFVEVEGVVGHFGFHKERLEANRAAVRELLDQLPETFHEATGGGWSFLMACQDRDGNQWTDLHRIMDDLFCLGIGLGLVRFLMPRAMWHMFPGGMPYVIVLEENGG